MYVHHASPVSTSPTYNHRAIVPTGPTYTPLHTEPGSQTHRLQQQQHCQHQTQPLPLTPQSFPFIHTSAPMMSLTPASMPRALHDLLHRLHWVAGTPAEHQICYKDMSYVRRGTLYACIKRFMLGEKRDNNMEKLYSDITDALEHLRYYYLTGNTDYVEKIANALIDIYETLSVIGRTTYYDDRSILSRLLVIRSEIKSALASCGLAKGIMLSSHDDLQTYVMTRFLSSTDNRQPTTTSPLLAPPQSPLPEMIIGQPRPVHQHSCSNTTTNPIPPFMSNQAAILFTPKESGTCNDKFVPPPVSSHAVTESINEQDQHPNHSKDTQTGSLYDSL